jgi:hypothetical protein
MRLLPIALIPAIAGCSVSSTTSCEPVGGIEPICGLQAPEDAAVVPWTTWLLISQMPAGEKPGSLAAINLESDQRIQLYPREGGDEPRPGWGDRACPGPPEASRFAPHGVDLSGSRLLVVAHGGREAVEIFELTLSPGKGEPSLSWRGCAIAPDDASLNDVAALADGGFAATKMVDRGGGWGAGTMLKMMLGGNTGHVLTWSQAGGWQKVPGSEGAGPNGIAATADGSMLFYSLFTGESVASIGRDGSGRREIPLDFKPDNLTWTQRGTLLAAGAAGSLAQVMGCAEVAAGACQASFAVAEIEPRDGSAREILRSDGEAGGGVSVAVEFMDRLYLGAFAGDRLLRAKAD